MNRTTSADYDYDWPTTRQDIVNRKERMDCEKLEIVILL